MHSRLITTGVGGMAEQQRNMSEGPGVTGGDTAVNHAGIFCFLLLKIKLKGISVFRKWSLKRVGGISLDDI